mgnify:CR=1 FL=1
MAERAQTRTSWPSLPGSDFSRCSAPAIAQDSESHTRTVTGGGGVSPSFTTSPGKGSIFTKGKLAKQIAELDQEIEAYGKSLDANDTEEARQQSLDLQDGSKGDGDDINAGQALLYTHGTAQGEVLPGSASDAMLPLDTVKSQAPLAPKSEGGEAGDTKGAKAAKQSGKASDAAADAPAVKAEASPATSPTEN